MAMMRIAVAITTAFLSAAALAGTATPVLAEDALRTVPDGPGGPAGNRLPPDFITSPELQALVNRIPPETLQALMGQATRLYQTYAEAPPGSPERQAVKDHRVELKALKAQVCAAFINCKGMAGR
jgi:hypothetical protein